MSFRSGLKSERKKDTTSSSEKLQHRSLNENRCILLCGVPCTAGDSLDKITLEKWESIHEKSLRWKGLDRYQDVYENVVWEKGPKGHYMRNNCYTCLSSKCWLTQAENRKRKLTKERDKTCKKRSFFRDQLRVVLGLCWPMGWVGSGWVNYSKSTKNLKGLC